MAFIDQTKTASSSERVAAPAQKEKPRGKQRKAVSMSLRIESITEEPELAQQLDIENRKDIVEGGNGDTLLLFAARSGELKLVQQLVLEHKIDANEKNEQGMTALMAAAQGGYLDVVQWLVAEGKANISEKNKQGKTALTLAADKNHLAIIEFLLSWNDSTELTNAKLSKAQDKLFQDVKSVAASSKQAKPLKSRLESSVIPFLQTVRKRKLQAIQRLFEQNPESILDADKDGSTVLHNAAGCGHLELVQWLWQKDGASKRRGRDGETALLSAASGDQWEVVRWLLTEGNAKVSEEDNHGRTALLLAIYRGRLRIAQELILGRFFSISDKDKEGNTVLLYAILHGKLKIAEWLLTQGANIFETNTRGQTALELAIRYEHHSIAMGYTYYRAIRWVIEVGNLQSFAWADMKLSREEEPLFSEQYKEFQKAKRDVRAEKERTRKDQRTQKKSLQNSTSPAPPAGPQVDEKEKQETIKTLPQDVTHSTSLQRDAVNIEAHEEDEKIQEIRAKILDKQEKFKALTKKTECTQAMRTDFLKWQTEYKKLTFKVDVLSKYYQALYALVTFYEETIKCSRHKKLLAKRQEAVAFPAHCLADTLDEVSLAKKTHAKLLSLIDKNSEFCATPRGKACAGELQKPLNGLQAVLIEIEVKDREINKNAEMCATSNSIRAIQENIKKMHDLAKARESSVKKLPNRQDRIKKPCENFNKVLRAYNASQEAERIKALKIKIPPKKAASPKPALAVTPVPVVTPMPKQTHKIKSHRSRTQDLMQLLAMLALWQQPYSQGNSFLEDMLSYGNQIYILIKIIVLLHIDVVRDDKPTDKQLVDQRSATIVRDLFTHYFDFFFYFLCEKDVFAINIIQQSVAAMQQNLLKVIRHNSFFNGCFAQEILQEIEFNILMGKISPHDDTQHSLLDDLQNKIELEALPCVIPLKYTAERFKIEPSFMFERHRILVLTGLIPLICEFYNTTTSRPISEYKITSSSTFFSSGGTPVKRLDDDSWDARKNMLIVLLGACGIHTETSEKEEGNPLSCFMHDCRNIRNKLAHHSPIKLAELNSLCDEANIIEGLRVMV